MGSYIKEIIEEKDNGEKEIIKARPLEDLEGKEIIIFGTHFEYDIEDKKFLVVDDTDQNLFYTYSRKAIEQRLKIATMSVEGLGVKTKIKVNKKGEAYFYNPKKAWGLTMKDYRENRYLGKTMCDSQGRRRELRMLDCIFGQKITIINELLGFKEGVGYFLVIETNDEPLYYTFSKYAKEDFEAICEMRSRGLNVDVQVWHEEDGEISFIEPMPE